MRELILASGSSRRHSLIDQLNLKYRVSVSNIDEAITTGELPDDYVCRMAATKADVVFQSKTDNYSKDQVVLAADTIIVLGKEIIGKPKNVKHANAILKNLSNTRHDVLTALHIKAKEGEYKSLVRSSVKFKLLDDSEIAAYCMTSEPYDKAGAYAIQGAGASLVEYFSGSYTNVVGLPILATYELLKKCEIL